MSRNPDICKHIGLPPTPEVQQAYDAWQDAQEAEKAAGAAWTAAVDRARSAMPLLDRLMFAAYARCECGAGLAYDQANAGMNGAWDCSAILLGTAIPRGQPGAVKHTDRLPFAFYEIKSEGQPSANGASTRPSNGQHADRSGN